MLYGTYLTNNYIYLNLMSKIILSVAMVYVAFTPKNLKLLFKYIVVFYLTSFVFGGCAFFLLYYIKPQEILYKNGFLTGTYPIKIAFLGAIVGLALVSIAFKIIKNRLSKNDMFCEIQINYRENTTKIRAMIDTGNLLKDPITKIPVIVVEKEALRGIIEGNVLNRLEELVEGVNVDLIDEIGKDYISRFRLIPFSSLGKQNGMLIGFKPDSVIIQFDGTDIKENDVIIGIYNKAVSKNGNYSGLTRTRFIREEGSFKVNLLKILNNIYLKYIQKEKSNNDIDNIFYIAGSQTLPPPLEPKEEEEVLKRLALKDMDARQTLVERNLRLVVYIAKKFENTGIGIEDLISIGTIGLMKAINTFNTEKKIKLATYASRCIENEILMYLRRSNKIRGEVSIDEPLNQDGDGNELLLSDILRNRQ